MIVIIMSNLIECSTNSPIDQYSVSATSPSQKLEVLETIKTQIESMDKYHQIEILKILSNTLCKINENKSGVYINLSFLPQESIDEMVKYIKYINEQDTTFNTMEYQKQEFKNAFFVEKEDKDNRTVLYNSITK